MDAKPHATTNPKLVDSGKIEDFTTDCCESPDLDAPLIDGNEQLEQVVFHFVMTNEKMSSVEKKIWLENTMKELNQIDVCSVVGLLLDPIKVLERTSVSKEALLEILPIAVDKVKRLARGGQY